MNVMLEAFKMTVGEVPSCPLNLNQLAGCYGRSFHTTRAMVARYNLTLGELALPHVVLSHLENFGNDTPFRKSLRNPNVRAEISKRIQALIEKQSQA